MTELYAAGQAYWRDPQVEPPPRATKLLLLNPGGVAIIGHWAEWAVAWSPFPKMPASLKARLQVQLGLIRAAQLSAELERVNDE